MTTDQFSLLFIMVITVGYWVKTVMIGDRGKEHIALSAMLIAGAATFVGYFFNLFTYKFIGEIIGSILGIWVSDNDYRERYSDNEEG